MNGRLETQEEKIYYYVDTAEDTGQKFLVNMITYNDIPGLLPVHHQYIDEQICFIYETRGMVSLKEYCAKSVITVIQACQILTGMIDALEQGDSFFLKKAGYYIEPSCIFLNRREQRVAMCYLPEEEREFEQDFRRFVEFLLEHIAHSDKDAVSYFYHLYDFVCEKGALLSEIREHLILYQRENASGEEDIGTSRESHVVPLAGKAGKSGEAGKSKVAKTIEGDRFQLVLCNGKVDEKGKRITLVAAIPQVIHLQEGSYQIGRQGDRDICLLPNEISRSHARMEVLGQELYAVDHGSTNGTFLNGRKLSAHVKTRCVKDDVITFADISYRIVLP